VKPAADLDTFKGMSEDKPQISHEHPDVTGGWLRPAVFGASDGLVSNLALIAGVAGGTRAADSSTAVVLAGFAGLAAGAFSMAVGEYTSVASQSEAAAHEVEKERREIIANPEGETRELAAMYMQKGVDKQLAHEVARQIHEDVDRAVKVHAREEFGVDPHDLASPMLAAVSSFVAFGIGALIPLLPYLLGATNLLPGLVITLIALFGAGAVVTQVTTRPWWYGGVRQMLMGGIAAAITYGVGALVGMSGIG
jgi:VIT1/CCC1 family predicted Fe2+/Mn2+ transporter